MEHMSAEGVKLEGDFGPNLRRKVRKVLEHILQGFGHLYWIGLAFSITAFVLERIQQVSSNPDECIKLLKDMIFLAKILHVLSERMSHDTETLREAVETIVEGAFICCYFMEQRSIFRLLRAATVESSLEGIRDTLQFFISELNLLISQNVQAQQSHQSQNILQTPQPVGITKQAEEVKALLDMNGSGPAKAVIIYGIGGTGKTTLAEYVVSNLPLNGLKLSVVRINYENMEIKTLQEQILFDVAGIKQNLRNSREGREKLKEILKDRSCFLFIDNIVDKNQVKELLPQELNLRSETRLLITTRVNNVKEALCIECEEYPVEGLPDGKTARELLRNIVLQNGGNVIPDDMETSDLKKFDIESSDAEKSTAVFKLESNI